MNQVSGFGATMNGDGPAREGIVGAVATDESGAFYAITAARLFRDPFSVGGVERIGSNELLHAVRISDGKEQDGQPITVMPPSQALGQLVFRPAKPMLRAPGRVSGALGSVRVKGTERTVSGLFEVTFSSRTERQGRLPAVPNILPADVGSPIMNFDRAILGLIVGGTENTAIVAPIEPFLVAAGLTLLPTSQNGARDLTYGADDQFYTLQTQKALDLGDMPDVEAA